MRIRIDLDAYVSRGWALGLSVMVRRGIHLMLQVGPLVFNASVTHPSEDGE